MCPGDDRRNSCTRKHTRRPSCGAQETPPELDSPKEVQTLLELVEKECLETTLIRGSHSYVSKEKEARRSSVPKGQNFVSLCLRRRSLIRTVPPDRRWLETNPN